MKKMALTYEYNWMQGYSFVNIHVFSSGKEALKYQNEIAPTMFARGANTRKNNTIPPHGERQVGIGFRGINARYLEPDEIEIYKKFGDNTVCDQKNNKLIAPKEGNKC